MIYNPQIGMRVLFTDTSVSEYFGKTATILDLIDLSSDSRLVIAIIEFDCEAGSHLTHDFYIYRLSSLDPETEQQTRERFEEECKRLEDQKRRKEYADKYL